MSKGAAWGRRFMRNLRAIVRCSVNDGSPHEGRIEFAHIKPTPLTPNGHGRGLNDRALDIMHHPDCYLPLCAYHHLIRDGRNARTMRRHLGKVKSSSDGELMF